MKSQGHIIINGVTLFGVTEFLFRNRAGLMEADLVLCIC